MRKHLTILSVLLLAGQAMAATYYVGPTATGDESGSDEFNLMSYATWDGSDRSSDTCYFGADMTSTISEDFYWRPCQGYFAKYVQVYSANSVGYRFSDYTRIFQWAAGDIGVVDPGSGVSVTALDPSPTTASIFGSTVAVHGTMIDPVCAWSQGVHGSATSYSAALDVGPEIAAGTPYALTAGHTMVHTRGQTSYPGSAQWIVNAAALHCVAEVPASLSFRPTYAGATKTIHLASTVDTQIAAGRLASLSAPSSAPAYASTLSLIRPMWVEFLVGGAYGFTLHPTGSGRKGYGTELSSQFVEAALWTNTNQTASEKKMIAYMLVQAGIDAWGYICSSDDGRKMLTTDGGGHGQSKLRWAYAAWLLNDSTMLTALETKTGDYAEDAPTLTTFPNDMLHSAEEQVYTVSTDHILDTPYHVGISAFGSETGTVTVEHGSTAVVGNGTNWASVDDARNDMFALRNASWEATDDQATAPSPHGYRIASITDNTHLTLTTAYTGEDATGQMYVMAGGVEIGHGSAVSMDYEATEPIVAEYSLEDVGVPVWGIAYGTVPYEYPTGSTYANGWYTGSLGAFSHRYQNTFGQATAGAQLAAIIMGMRSIWNHDAAINYSDRLITVNDTPQFYMTWTRSMWNTYRANYTPVWTPKCHTPVPAHLATAVATSQVLSWFDGNGRATGTSCNVYFGTDSTPDETELVEMESTDYAYTPDLAAGTTYYWRVDEVCPGGTYPGDVWTFETEGETPPAGTKYLRIRSGS